MTRAVTQLKSAYRMVHIVTRWFIAGEKPCPGIH